MVFFSAGGSLNGAIRTGCRRPRRLVDRPSLAQARIRSAPPSDCDKSRAGSVDLVQATSAAHLLNPGIPDRKFRPGLPAPRVRTNSPDFQPARSSPPQRRRCLRKSRTKIGPGAIVVDQDQVSQAAHRCATARSPGSATYGICVRVHESRGIPMCASCDRKGKCTKCRTRETDRPVLESPDCRLRLERFRPIVRAGRH